MARRRSSRRRPFPRRLAVFPAALITLALITLVLITLPTLALLAPTPVDLAGLAAADSGPCSSPAAAGNHSELLTIDGRPRSVLVHVPPGIVAGRRLPLVLALAGFRSDGATMERSSGFSALADARGFVVAYPSAPADQWHIYAGEPRARLDLDYMRATIDRLSSTLCLDAGRRFAAGVSNGAGEVARMACALSDELAAAALVAGDYRSLPVCQPPRPVSILEIHGTSDRIVPYNGRRGDHSGSVAGLLATWRGIDGCRRAATSRALSATITRMLWVCAHNTTVAHLRYAGVGHAWPGAYPPPGTVPASGSAGYEIWRFFDSLRPRTR